MQAIYHFSMRTMFTARIAINRRGKQLLVGNYDQPLYVEERNQVDFTYQYRMNESTTLFFDAMNITDEPTRLYADTKRYSSYLKIMAYL